MLLALWIQTLLHPTAADALHALAATGALAAYGGFTGAYLQLRSGWSVRVFALAEAYGGGRSQRRRVVEVAEALRARQRPAARA
jgi:hypothetical protein